MPKNKAQRGRPAKVIPPLPNIGLVAATAAVLGIKPPDNIEEPTQDKNLEAKKDEAWTRRLVMYISPPKSANAGAGYAV